MPERAPGLVRRPRRPGGGGWLTTGSVLLALAGGAAGGLRVPPWWALLLLPLAVVASEVVGGVALPGRLRWSGAATEAVVAVTLVLRPGAWLPVLVLVAAAAVQLGRGRPRARAFEAAARLAAATGAAVAVTAGLDRLGDGSILAAALGMVAWWAVAHLLAVAAVVRTTGRGLRRLLANRAPESFVVTAVGGAVGITTAWLGVHAPAGLLGLLAPLALLASSARHSARQATEARLFAELARGQEIASGRSVDESAMLVVTAAARLLGGADVELVLLTGEGALRYSGDEVGTPVRTRVDPAAFDDPWLLRALGGGVRAVRSGVQAGRPVLATLLGGGDVAPLAALVARRPAGATAFGRRELLLAEVLAVQAESWLSVAGITASRDAALERVASAAGTTRALSDIGADTAPSLSMLRESAARLSRLAGGGGRGAAMTDGAAAAVVGDIVDELHVVERSVASLLGAIAIAADADLADAAHGLTEPRPGADVQWTTTGVLA